MTPQRFSASYTSRLLLLPAFVVALGFLSAAHAQEWGTLKGRFVFDGDVPEAKDVNVTKDTEFCSKHDLKDEEVVVGEKKGLANTFVYLYLKRGAKATIHPDLEKPGEPIVLDNKGCRFEPHVLLVRTGQKLKITNSDQGIGHNTNAALNQNPTFNETVSNASPIIKEFSKSESYPVGVSCNVHPWMKAHMLIRDNPYMAISAADGTFEIAKLPAGKHEFIIWHESVANMKKLTVGSAGKTNSRGRIKIEIPAGGELDLGEIKVKPADLKL